LLLGSKRKGAPPRVRRAGRSRPVSAAAPARRTAAARAGLAESSPPAAGRAGQDAADRYGHPADPGDGAPDHGDGAADQNDGAADQNDGAADQDDGAKPPGPPEVPGAPQSVRPPTPGRDPLWARLLIVFGALLALMSGTLIGASKVLAHRYESSVKKDTLLAQDARATPREEPARIVGPLNYLLLGSDARPDNPSAGQRADSIIVAHVPAGLDRAYLISIPRDLRVEIPPYAPTNFRGSRDKINAAYEYGGGGSGGVQLISMTLANLLGVRFDGAALVDFDGFQNVVKALGGVDMCIDHRVVSEHVGFDEDGKYLHPDRGGKAVVYEVGCRELNGWQALDYVRQRYSLPDGDYGRQRHQQQFLQALLVRARQQGVATNPIKLDRLIRTVFGTLTVDTGGVPLDALAFGLRDIRSDDIVGITVPSEPTWIGNTSYILPFDEALNLYQAIADDSLEAWADANPTWVNRL
jgi:LCP family protein required for cell wall assembly